ncbi:MAG TPA: hypothetical protein VGW34_02305 [Allosphingosinicella sp.]|nr:hypothetical protein [Allosphingosinicella sp.]
MIKQGFQASCFAFAIAGSCVLASSAIAQNDNMRPLTGTKPASERTEPPYVLASGPVIVSPEGRKGAVMFSGTLGYRYTGRISNDAVSNRPFSAGSKDIGKGQFVYGVPMATTNRYGRVKSGPQFYWCAPVNKGNGKWRATCVNSEGVAPAVNHSAFPTFMVQRVVGHWLRSQPVTVIEEPLAPPLTAQLRYEFREWNSRGLKLRVHAGQSGVSHDWFDLELPRAKGRAALIRLGSGLYEVSPAGGGDGYAIATKVAPTGGGSAIPTIG